MRFYSIKSHFRFNFGLGLFLFLIHSSSLVRADGSFFSRAGPFQAYDDLLSELTARDHHLGFPVGTTYGHPTTSSARTTETDFWNDWVSAVGGLQTTVSDITTPDSARECVGPTLVTPGNPPPPERKPERSAALLSREDALLQYAEQLGFEPQLFRNFLANDVPYQPLYRALEYWARNPDFVTNRERLTLVDFSRHANEDRFWVLDLVSGTIQVQTRVAAGSNSDARPRDGYIESCSNESGSLQSSFGAMRITRGGFDPSRNWGSSRPHYLTIEGGEEVNDRCDARGILIHGAPYCSESSCMGRSHGCFAIPQGVVNEIADDVAGGSLLYAYAPQCE